MSVVRVAVPVMRGKRRFHLLKGRPWSPIEHLILQAVVKEPRTAEVLAEKSGLPKRLIIEALIRLMRADWVEVSPQPAGTLFRATAGGREKSDFDELPNIPKAMTRWMTFVIDRVTGMTFRGRELPIFEKHVLDQRAERETLVWLQPSQSIFREEPRAVFSALLEEDETIVDIDAAGDRPVDRFAMITVRNGKPEGLPKAATDLELAIIEAAGKVAQLKQSSQALSVRASIEPKRLDSSLPILRQVGFQQGDMILGGDAHMTAFTNLIKRARERIVIHSTFVSANSLEAVMPLISDAGRRGVRVDILWGENEDKPEAEATKQVLSKARTKLAETGLDNLVVIHPFSTGSHAKVLIADDGQTGKDVAIIGSCNWLYSGFQSFEASIRLRDPEIVADVLDAVSELSQGWDGLWTPLTISLSTWAREVRSRPPLMGARLQASLVFGAQHGQLVREARDNAKRRIFVASHRLGSSAKQAIIIPAIAAAHDARGVETQVYFGRPSGNMTGATAAELTLDAGKHGVRIRSIHEPRLHAKILAWDDDCVVISSQNWLSADPGYNSPLQEIGVYLKGARIAENVIATFNNARSF